MNDNVLYWLWLYTIKGIGPKKFRLFKKRFNYLKDAFETRNDLAMDFFSQELINSIRNSDLSRAEKVLEFCQKNSINIILEEDENYPRGFRYFDDAPVILFAKGDIDILKSKNLISIVGTREPTFYGKKIAQELSERLANHGLIVVSGMARGIDTFCHMGALKSGKTIAVLGCGVDIVYPKENYKLYHQIIKNGCVISEFLPNTLPDRMNFPQRNRIISMLSPCLVVIEAAVKSGTFSTVDFALEQGKEVFAVPGNITSEKSSGTNRLIKEGARIICSYDDFIFDISDIYGLKPQQLSIFEDELTEDEVKLLDILDRAGPSNIENLIMLSNWSASKVASIITSLEIKGKVGRDKGNTIVKL